MRTFPLIFVAAQLLAVAPLHAQTLECKQIVGEARPGDEHAESTVKLSEEDYQEGFRITGGGCLQTPAFGEQFVFSRGQVPTTRDFTCSLAGPTHVIERIQPYAIACRQAPTPAQSAGECKYHHVNGKDWRAVEQDKSGRLFHAVASCKRPDMSKALYPVSGGIRFEGIWNEISMGEKWKLVQSQVWDPDNLPLSGYSCMVMRTSSTPRKETPDALWCSVLCCP
jgi:hypothetical protein